MPVHVIPTSAANDLDNSYQEMMMDNCLPTVPCSSFVES